MKLKNLNVIIIALAIFSVLGTACTKKTTTTPNPTPAVATVTGVKLSTSTTLGSVITDNLGQSLYFFAKDVAGTPTFTGAAWPAFYKENAVIGTGLNAADFTTLTRADGSKQLAYKGWPLYYNATDKVGDTGGDGANSLWFVAKADYTIMIGNTQLVGNDAAKYTSDGSTLTAGTGTTSYLTDDHGHTLYAFKGDISGVNKFTAADFINNTAWPIDEFAAGAVLGSVPSILDKAAFTTITVATSHKQLVYKGHPLYFFGLDATTAGSTKGVSIPNGQTPSWKILNSSTTAL